MLTTCSIIMRDFERLLFLILSSSVLLCVAVSGGCTKCTPKRAPSYFKTITQIFEHIIIFIYENRHGIIKRTPLFKHRLLPLFDAWYAIFPHRRKHVPYNNHSSHTWCRRASAGPTVMWLRRLTKSNLFLISLLRSRTHTLTHIKLDLKADSSAIPLRQTHPSKPWTHPLANPNIIFLKGCPSQTTEHFHDLLPTGNRLLLLS